MSIVSLRKKEGMRIHGRIEDSTPLMSARLVIGSLKINKPLTFQIDPGSPTTCILDKDCKTLRIDYSKLQKSKDESIGIGGTCETFEARDAALVFKCADNSLHHEILEKIFFLRHSGSNNKRRRTAMILPSLLGRDVILRYTLLLNNKKVYLEK